MAELDRVFHALSDETRRAILARLTMGEATVGELASPFDSTLQAVSKHLKVLEGAGLVRRRVEGRVHRIALAPAALGPAAEWLAEYQQLWERKVDALADYAERLHQERTNANNTTVVKGPRRRRKKDD